MWNLRYAISADVTLDIHRQFCILHHVTLPHIILSKGKVFPLQARLWPRGWVQLWLYSFMTTALEGGEWSATRLGPTLPPGKTRCPLYRRLGGPQGRSERAENLAAPGFDPRNVQPLDSRYTN